MTIISNVPPEPPVPTAAPTLLEKRSKQLLVRPVDSHRGDGPITSTKVLYMPAQNANSWSSIIGKQAKMLFGKCHWVSLCNRRLKLTVLIMIDIKKKRFFELPRKRKCSETLGGYKNGGCKHKAKFGIF